MEQSMRQHRCEETITPEQPAEDQPTDNIDRQ